MQITARKLSCESVSFERLAMLGQIDSSTTDVIAAKTIHCDRNAL